MIRKKGQCKVIIADSHEIYRMGLKVFLGMIRDVDIIGDVSNDDELIRVMETKTPDILFMDINTAMKNNIQVVRKISQKYPGVKVIALGTWEENDHFEKMILTGVEGCMLKNDTLADFKTAIEKVMQGGNYFSEELLVNFTRSSLIGKFKVKEIISGITKRESEVLNLICKGYSNKKIGEELFISNRTVERHKTNLMQKTNNDNTVKLILFAIKNKLVELE